MKKRTATNLTHQNPLVFTSNRRKSKVRIGGNQKLNSSGLSYFDSKEGIRTQKLSVNINDGSFLLNGKRSSSIKSRYRRSSEFESLGNFNSKNSSNYPKQKNQGMRYSSVRRRDQKIKAPYGNKRSSSLSQTYSAKQLMKEKKRKKVLLERNLEEMRTMYKSDNYEGAIFKGEEVLKEHPKDLDALYIYGLSCSMVEKHKAAVDVFEKLIQMEPRYKKTKTIYLFLSIGYKKLGSIDKGVEVLDQAIENFPEFYEAYVSSQLTPSRFTEENYT